MAGLSRWDAVHLTPHLRHKGSTTQPCRQSPRSSPSEATAQATSALRGQTAAPWCLWENERHAGRVPGGSRSPWEEVPAIPMLVTGAATQARSPCPPDPPDTRAPSRAGPVCPCAASAPACLLGEEPRKPQAARGPAAAWYEGTSRSLRLAR